MKFSHENLEIWQLGMKLVELVYSFRDRFLTEDKFGLWDQLVRAAEAVPRDIAEGYGKSSKKERALYMERAKSELAEADTSFKEAIKKERIQHEEYENLIQPLIKELYFKLIGYRKWLLGISQAKRFPKRSDPPSEVINQGVSRSPTGFTLIEVLMTVFILGIVIVVGGNLFFSILKGASKTELTKEVKQNGDYAMAVMERMIKGATALDCTGAPSAITITSPDSLPTIFRCLAGVGVTKIASNSGALTGDNVSLGASCPGSLSFICYEDVSPPKVKVSFTLYQKGSSTRPEEQAQVPFQTTVSLRTY